MIHLDSLFMRTKYIFSVTVLWCFFIVFCWAESPNNEGVKAFSNENYAEAVDFFSTQVAKAPSVEGFYNLGNAHYKLKQYPEAVIAYLRALRINPSFEDAAYNLQLTQQKIAPGHATLSNMPWENPLTLLLDCGSVQKWTSISFICLILAAICWNLFRILSHRIIQRVALLSTFVLVISFFITSLAAICQRYRYYHNSLAVITSDQAQTYASPILNSKKEMLLPAGSIVNLQDIDNKGWARVQTSDGSETWIHLAQLEQVRDKD